MSRGCNISITQPFPLIMGMLPVHARVSPILPSDSQASFFLVPTCAGSEWLLVHLSMHP